MAFNYYDGSVPIKFDNPDILLEQDKFIDFLIETGHEDEYVLEDIYVEFNINNSTPVIHVHMDDKNRIKPRIGFAAEVPHLSTHEQGLRNVVLSLFNYINKEFYFIKRK